jgi:hypothetical protein
MTLTAKPFSKNIGNEIPISDMHIQTSNLALYFCFCSYFITAGVVEKSLE